MRPLLLCILAQFTLVCANAQQKPIQWIGKTNWIVNPGAEANGDQKPLYWKTDFTTITENDWVADYGRMSHEWNHGSLKGLPPNPGNNYFRLTVNNQATDRKINIYQEYALTEVEKILPLDTVMFVFSGQVAATYNLAANCTFTNIKLVFFDGANHPIDSIVIHKTPTDFKNLPEEGMDEDIKVELSVLHQFQAFNSSKEVPKAARKVRVELYCEFPCFVKNEEDETEGSNFNTYFFDNLFLGFYKH